LIGHRSAQIPTDLFSEGIEYVPFDPSLRAKMKEKPTLTVSRLPRILQPSFVLCYQNLGCLPLHNSPVVNQYISTLFTHTFIFLQHLYWRVRWGCTTILSTFSHHCILINLLQEPMTKPIIDTTEDLDTLLGQACVCTILKICVHPVRYFHIQRGPSVCR